MASPKATLNIVQTVVFSTAETAINQYAALFLSTSADMTARLPAAAASTLKFLGFARFPLASGATSIEVITLGHAIAKAEAAITRGDSLEAGSATGTVQTATTGTVIARALESAGAAGDYIRVEILKVA
jgi:hypothetical protein